MLAPTLLQARAELRQVMADDGGKKLNQARGRAACACNALWRRMPALHRIVWTLHAACIHASSGSSSHGRRTKARCRSAGSMQARASAC